MPQKSCSPLESDIQWDKWGHRSTQGSFRSWCGNVHSFHFCQSQSAGVKLLRGTISLRWPASPGSGGGNTALYQQLWFLPTHTHRKKRKHKHACGASTCRWLGSPLHAFLFRQRQCETEETQRSDCAPGCAGSSAVRRLYWRCFVLFVGVLGRGGWERGFSNFRCIQYIWNWVEKGLSEWVRE